MAFNGFYKIRPTLILPSSSGLPVASDRILPLASGRTSDRIRAHDSHYRVIRYSRPQMAAICLGHNVGYLCVPVHHPELFQNSSSEFQILKLTTSSHTGTLRFTFQQKQHQNLCIPDEGFLLFSLLVQCKEKKDHIFESQIQQVRSSYYEQHPSSNMTVTVRRSLSQSLLLLLLMMMIPGSAQKVAGFTRYSAHTRRRLPFGMQYHHHHHHHRIISSSSLFSSTKEQSETTSNNSLNNIKKPMNIPESEEEIATKIASFTSPVLQQVYSSLLQHVTEFGNPNIPLGTSAGRQCQTLRRLHIQQKLTALEVQALDDLGFYWHTLEDVYYTADFDDLLQRLKNYQKGMMMLEKKNSDDEQVDLFPPKKYPADPELGAWVTGIRRVGRDGVSPEHLQALERELEVSFAWVSQRRCGSKFMQQYRALLQRLADINDNDEEHSNDDDDDGAGSNNNAKKKTMKRSALWREEPIQQWVYAQRETAARGGLSETRLHYMETLLGEDWRTVDMNSL
jgi:hypothetical protein